MDYRNYGKKKNLKKYDAFLLLTNDIEFSNYKFISKLIRIMNKHKKIGILSPCSKNWGEKIYLKKKIKPNIFGLYIMPVIF